MAEGPETQPSTSSSDLSSSQVSSQVSPSDSLKSSNGNIPIFPIMYPAFVPGIVPQHQDQEHINRGPGLYAVPVMSYMHPIAGFPSNTLIPFTYNIPTNHSSPESREVGSEQGQPREQPQHQEAGPQRQVVVRRFQIAIQLDLLLILKLAAVVFLFNQDGSKQRLTLLVFFASLVYLYQTGALAPMVQWLSQGMRRAAAPPQPQPPRPAAAVRAAQNNNENAGIVGENENQEANDDNRAVENEHIADEAEAANRWWGIAKEIQMIVFGFITSLLPGFHNID